MHIDGVGRDVCFLVIESTRYTDPALLSTVICCTVRTALSGENKKLDATCKLKHWHASLFNADHFDVLHQGPPSQTLAGAYPRLISGFFAQICQLYGLFIFSFGVVYKLSEQPLFQTLAKNRSGQTMQNGGTMYTWALRQAGTTRQAIRHWKLRWDYHYIRRHH